ncbi:MAG: VOC family protein [Alphaproteobacteria bacterium]|nr:VOC family protein [Alphaproteobacteria bacterium]
MPAAIKPIPDGYTSVTPWIIGEDTAGLMEFLKVAFDAEEEGLINGPDGRISHAEMRIGNAMVMMFDAPEGWPPTPGFLRLYVEDVEATLQRAVRAGAEVVTRVTLLGFGDKVGRVRDPFGNAYWIQQRVENVSGEEMLRRWDNPKWQDAMAYLQGALAKAVR